MWRTGSQTRSCRAAVPPHVGGLLHNVRHVARPVAAYVVGNEASKGAPAAAAAPVPAIKPSPLEQPPSASSTSALAADKAPLPTAELTNRNDLTEGETDSEPEQDWAGHSAKAVPVEQDSQDGETETAIPSDASTEDKSDAYSEVMNRKMGTSLHYRHELGLDYNRILPDLIVGSCLQTPADVDRLAEQEGVTTVYCLQEDSDMAYFSLDITAIQTRCEERGDIKHVRFPIRDFDPYDLRRKLPRAVSRLAKEHNPTTGGTVYIHCTAGMGRAPATALAYMVWIRGWQLDEAHTHLRSLRACGPKLEAIRSATSDLLLGTQAVQTTIALHRWGNAQRIQVAGLDVGWHAPLEMSKDNATRRYVLHRRLHPGKYQYKFIIDGVWSVSADHPTVQDGTNVNNVLEVIPAAMDEMTIQKQVRYLTTGSRLTEEEQAELNALLNPWRNPDDDVANAYLTHSSDDVAMEGALQADMDEL